MMFQGNARKLQDFWANKHLQTPGFHDSYWKQTPQRQFVAEKICALPGVSSVLELGCNVGANLMAIHKINPCIRLSGIDVNESALNYGKAKFRECGVRAKFRNRSMLNLNEYPSKSHDVVFTYAVLMHVPGKEVREQVIPNALRIARKFVVHSELHAFSEREAEYYKSIANTQMKDREWRDYFSLYSEFVPLDHISISQCPDVIRIVPNLVTDPQCPNALVVVQKSPNSRNSLLKKAAVCARRVMLR